MIINKKKTERKKEFGSRSSSSTRKVISFPLIIKLAA
jgi:hypothetical protein